MTKVTVLGGGGWAIALAKVLHENGNQVTIWSALPREVEQLSKGRENKISLPGIKIPEEIAITNDIASAVENSEIIVMADAISFVIASAITNDIASAVENSEIIVMAVASSFVRSTANNLKGLIKEGQIIVDVAKGIEDETLYTMTEVIEDELPMADAVVLSGPSHAEEVGRNIPTVVVVGAKSKETATKVQSFFANKYFRTYISPDRKSIELGGSLKNVIALAAGISDGLGFGDNTEAALITRGIKEIKQLGCAMGGHARTFYGLSGIGDLIVTCNSKHSRNRRAGVLIGKGYTLNEAVSEVKMVVEGAVSAKAALDLARKYDVNVPIIKEVNAVLFDNKPAIDAMWELMNREQRREYDDLKW